MLTRYTYYIDISEKIILHTIDKEGAYCMKVHVENVFKNMRYKIFSVDGEHYILEIKPSFWKILFPFL